MAPEVSLPHSEKSATEPILSQMNLIPIQLRTISILTFHKCIYLPSNYSFRFPDQNSIYISHHSHAISNYYSILQKKLLLHFDKNVRVL